ncbi:MAG: UDP-3-O-(3-hydroxymyristoyl)glucosamine N-acyltransferase [Rickettsiales bacterium]|jgi:UDP-3-O-[3-hydroxymyristoyl] glucosamine N-acyltransferase|nr:UDP-3-O-(3-hydroxymyristoyl)glucosamine N-acyltransferase [Rickettsiales bacterium]
MEQFYEVSKGMTLAEIAALTGSDVKCDGARIIKRLAPLESADSDSICFLASIGSAAAYLDKRAKYREMLGALKAAACFVSPADAELLPATVAAVITPDPRMAFITLTNAFYKDKSTAQTGISPHAVISETATFKDRASCTICDFAVIEAGAKIGANAYIGSGTKIKAGVELGDNCTIRENAVISHAILGSNVGIGEGSVIGGAGFGWHTTAAGHTWVPQLGRVILGDNVDIGINTCIDRGALGDTVIGEGTKIDNLVQIGHNCRIGKNCIFAGMSGIAGSTEIGDWTLAGAQSGISGHLKIGAGSQIGAGAGVIQDLPPKSVVSGYPAQPAHDFLKQTAMLRRMVKGKK